MIGKKNTGLFCLVLAALMLFGCVTTKNLQTEHQMQNFGSGISILIQYQVVSKGSDTQKSQRFLGLPQQVRVKDIEKINVVLVVDNPLNTTYQVKKEIIVEVSTSDGLMFTREEEIAYKGKDKRVSFIMDAPIIENRKITIRVTLLNKKGGVLLRAGEATYKCKP